MFEWVDKNSGETVRLSADDAAKMLNKSFGRDVKVKRSRSWIWLAAACGSVLLVIATCGWEYEQRQEIMADTITKEYYIEFLSWDLPPYKSERLSQTEYIQESLAKGNMRWDAENEAITVVTSGKLLHRNPKIDIRGEGRSVSKD